MKKFILPALLSAAFLAAAETVKVPFVQFDQHLVYFLWHNPKNPGEKYFNSDSTLKLRYPNDREIRVTPYFRGHVTRVFRPTEKHYGAELTLNAASPGWVDVQIQRSTEKRPSDRCKVRYQAGLQTVKIPIPEFTGFITQVRLVSDQPGLDVELIRLDKIVERSYAGSFNLDVETPHWPFVLITPDTKAQSKFKVENYTGRPFKGSLKLDLTNELDGHFTQTFKEIEIPAYGSKLLPVDTKKLVYGSWKVTAELESKEGKVPLFTRFGYMDPAGRRDAKEGDFLFGLGDCETYSYPKFMRDKDADYQTLAGFNSWRGGCDWWRIQPNNEEEWNDEEYRDELQRYGSRGYRMTSMLSGTPKWAADPDVTGKRKHLTIRNTACEMPKLDAYRRFAERYVKAYKKYVWAWEIYNEPDIEFFHGDEEDYKQMLSISREVVKKEAPETKVMTGGFCTARNYLHPKPKFLETILRDCKQDYEIIAHHEHGLFFAMEKMMEELFFPILKRTGATAPWLCNETAWAPLSPGYEYMQGEQYYKKVLYVMGRGGIGHYWFCFRNYGFNEGFAPWNYGLLTYDGRPKPGYIAANATIKLFRESRAAGKIEFGDKACHVYSFKAPDGILFATWIENEMKGSVLPKLYRTDAKKVTSFDLYGNPRTEPLKDGIFLLKPEFRCRSWKLEGATFCLEVGVPVDVQCRFDAQGGVTAQVKWRDLLPGARDKVKVTLTLPDGMSSVGKATKAMQVNKAGELRFSGRISDPAKLRRNPVLKGTLAVDSAKLGKMEINFFMTRPPVPLNAKFDPAKPDFVMDTLENNVSVYSAIPSGNHLVWKGPEDLSVKLWMWLEKERLNLHAEVTDDILKTKPVNFMSMRDGDCLQIIIGVPGLKDFWWFLFTHQTQKGLAGLFIGHGEKQYYPLIWKTKYHKVRREGNKTIYDFSVPLASLGLTPEMCYSGKVTFDCMVSDDDGEGLEGWMQLTRGGAREKLPELFIPVRFTK